MTLARKLGICLLAIFLPGIAAPAQPPAQGLAAQDQNAPIPESQQPKPDVPASEQTNPQVPATPASPDTQPQTTQPPSGKRSEKKKHRKKKKSSPKPATVSDGPKKTVVTNGSTAEPEVKFSPDTTTDQQNRQRGKVNYLLNSTDDNLKKISNRQLSPTQQDSVNQIRSYMEQAKSALTEGDLQRGENLATKARLLSDDLLKH
jgi:outer membrane biosynthesis protein TonB